MEIPKFGLALILLILFCIIFLWRRDATRNKTMVVMAGFGSSLMAVISGLGFGLAIGYPAHFNPVVTFMPFLILAIGMDDLFVILRSYELTSPMLPAERRIEAAMCEGGLSITITSLTDLIAFLGGGLMIQIPALRDMCLFVS